MLSTHPFQTRVAFLGNPNSNDPFKFWREVPWSEENLLRLKQLGFNTIQVNVAWGPRPGDEPLNLEDVVQLPESLESEYPQVVPLRCDPAPEARTRRRANLTLRSELCHALGLRTIFHFGAPYNAHMRYGDGPPNCLSDERNTFRYLRLLEILAHEFKDIDDILIYTYDQDAWLCSEFGPCPRCLGTPLHERVTNFLNALSTAWQALRPGSRMWWEPWELSAGQVYQCVDRLTPQNTGLSLHSNVAEVMATHPADRWLKNTASQAARRNIPVIAEYWLGGPCEELEPLLNLAHPLVTWRGLQALAHVTGICGIKEYYGLDPDREDANLRATALFLEHPELSEEEVVAELARPYQDAASEMAKFWQLTSQGMEFFPWETSWFIRQVGRSRVDHALTAARIRGMPCRTPSWCSTRYAIFMQAYENNDEQFPWFLEDVGLRCLAASEHWLAALKFGKELIPVVPCNLRHSFQKTLVDLGRLQRRALAYANHLRETNLAFIARQVPHPPARVLEEMRQCLLSDLANYTAEQLSAVEADHLGMVSLTPETTLPDWEEIQQALSALDQSSVEFLSRFFNEAPDIASKGLFSVTSR